MPAVGVSSFSELRIIASTSSWPVSPIRRAIRRFRAADTAFSCSASTVLDSSAELPLMPPLSLDACSKSPDFVISSLIISTTRSQPSRMFSFARSIAVRPLASFAYMLQPALIRRSTHRKCAAWDAHRNAVMPNSSSTASTFAPCLSSMSRHCCCPFKAAIMSAVPPVSGSTESGETPRRAVATNGVSLSQPLQPKAPRVLQSDRAACACARTTL